MTIPRFATLSLALVAALPMLIAGMAALANPVAHASAASVALPATDQSGAIALVLLGIAFAAAALLTSRLAR